MGERIGILCESPHRDLRIAGGTGAETEMGKAAEQRNPKKSDRRDGVAWRGRQAVLLDAPVVCALGWQYRRLVDLKRERFAMQLAVRGVACVFVTPRPRQ